MIKPITPKEAANGNRIPDFVIQAFNELIAQDFINHRAWVYQEDVIDRILKYAKNESSEYENVTRETIFQRGWLNIEGLYTSIGWKVEYDKPGFNENSTPRFLFTSR